MKEITLSPLELHPEANIRREMPRPPQLRSPDYEEKFDSLTVFYDCFASADGTSCVLLGPPLFNLESAVLSSFPALFGCNSSSQVRLVSPHSRTKHNLSSQLWLKSTQRRITIPSADFRQREILIQPNEFDLFSGRKVLLTLSKDNEICWIRDWVHFFARLHECDAVLFYDNTSVAYEASEIHDAISSVAGIEVSVVVSWPYKYGPQGSDSFHEAQRQRSTSPPLPWDSTYCQPAMLEHARHRFLGCAEAVINADIDEFVLTKNREPICDMIRRSDTGYLLYPGQWIESATKAVGEIPRHFHYFHRAKSPAGGFMWKWAVAPRRCPQEARWLPHKISRMKADSLSNFVSYRHFRAINTSWKYSRGAACLPSDEHVRDEELKAAMQVLEQPTDQSWLHQLEARLKIRNDELGTLASTLETRDKEISSLKSELATQKSALNNLLRSTSWRITAPVRRLKEISEKIRRLFRTKAH